jgi:serine O-acetyltransferase
VVDISEVWNGLAQVAHELQKGSETHPILQIKKRPVPDRDEVIRFLMEVRRVLFPGYFSPPSEGKNTAALLEQLGGLFWRLACLIHDSKDHECSSPCKDREASVCEAFHHSLQLAHDFVRKLPHIRAMLAQDIEAAYDGDPAATNFDEVILAYPSLFAVMVYRVAHELHLAGVPLIPRIMTEYAHSRTGIDIHPGATIGHSFFIDHGTGVVIGETCVIGNHVKIYQGVTLGALSFEKNEDGQLVRGTKRHPTIEDHVTIYSGATVLGGNTVIGEGSIIGGNVWLIESVPPRSKVISRPQIEMR